MPRLAGGRSVTSRPPSRTVPEVGRTNPASALSAVDLPDPLGPSSATVSPAADPQVEVDQRVGRLLPAAVGHPDAVEGDCRDDVRVRSRLLGRGLRALLPRYRRSVLPPDPRSRPSSVPGGLLVRGDVGVEVGEHGVPVRHPHLDAVEHCRRACSVPATPPRWRGSRRAPGCRARRASTVFCTSSDSRNSSSFLADVLVRRALGDARDVGQRDGGALAVGVRRG